MNEKLMDKLEELFDVLDNCEEIKEMISLKQEIYTDEALKHMLDNYKKEINNYDPKIVSLKKDIVEHPLVVRYRALENELYFTVLEMNQKYESLFDKKRCHDARN